MCRLRVQSATSHLIWKMIMDNLKVKLSNIQLDCDRFIDGLTAQGMQVTARYGAGRHIAAIKFSCPMGKFKERWLISVEPRSARLTVSGGVTKTFFGHNLWVFNNEGVQLKTILGILVRRISKLDGLALSQSPQDISIERVEVTNHFALPPSVEPSEAINKLDVLFKALFAGRSFRNGETLEAPGTIGVGLSKSNRICRIYDPDWKERPSHISAESWNQLVGACDRHLRVENIILSRDMQRWELGSVSAWEDDTKIREYLEDRFRYLGLSFEYKFDIDGPCNDALSLNQKFLEYAFHWASEGKRGVEPDKRSGSYGRFKKRMEELGFDVTVSFLRHELLAHGMHDILKPAMRADLPMEVRTNAELFDFWWREEEDE
jgi:hypothetical protein